jgi:hypothetical protein
MIARLKFQLVSLISTALLTTGCAGGADRATDDPTTSAQALSIIETTDAALLPVGPSDELAKTECTVANATPVSLIAATTEDTAALVVFTPSAARPYHVRLPEGRKGYARIQVADWHVAVAIAVDGTTPVAIAGVQSTLSTSRNGSCPGALTERRWIIHEWGAYTIEFGETGPRDITIAVVEQH